MGGGTISSIINRPPSPVPRFVIAMVFYDVAVLRGRSSVWLERRPVTSEVAGSNPVVPATHRRHRKSESLAWTLKNATMTRLTKFLGQKSSLMAKVNCRWP